MILAAWVAACVRARFLVLLLALMLAVSALWTIRNRLAVTTDTGLIFAADLPWRQNGTELQRAFPQNEDLLVAVVDATIPEEAELTARDLAAALRADTAHFSHVSQPDASPFLTRNALLFLDAGTLQGLLERTVDSQPFLGVLVADTNLRGLCAALSLIAQGVGHGQAGLDAFMPALRSFHASLQAAARGDAVDLSWERLLAGPVADLGGRFHFVLAKPVLDYGAVEPGKSAGAAIRDQAGRLEFVRAGHARVRITGSVALNDEEFATVAQGAIAGVIGSTVLVTLWLFLAVRSWRLIVPILLTLFLGLLLTGAFAAIAVGTLNLVSVAFAILFIGIAVDFAIQFTVRLREARSDAQGLAGALSLTAKRAGMQILVASLSTSAGFLAFTPTAFIGVAQLGLIAGGGMLIAFVCTMTFLPAFISVCAPRAAGAERAVGVGLALGRLIERRRKLVLAVFGAGALCGLAALPRLSFDSDPLHTKNAHTEAMRTLGDLMNDPVTNPYTMELLAPTMAQAAATASRLEALPMVESVTWLRSFVPGDQTEKLAMITDTRALLESTLTPPPRIGPVPAPALRTASIHAAEAIRAVLPRLPAGHPLGLIQADLARLGAAPDHVILEASEAMTRFLPLQVARLRAALGATRISETDIPNDVRVDWIAPDGRPRLQVTPKASVRGSAALLRFVNQVQGVAPNAAGSAVTIVRSAQTVVAAFRSAALNALIAITLILIAVLRRALDVMLVLLPLIVSSLLVLLLAVSVHLPLNFANIIALPLLLGVGVSFNIYLVMDWRAGKRHPLGSATARAVGFSALTTGTAFGSLALSHHPGTASMGVLLLLSLACMVASALVFLPALLASMPVVLIVLVMGSGAARAASPRPPDFTAAQAADGAGVYALHCAACHGAALQGGAAPALTGVPFRTQWAAPRRSLLDLLTYLHANMPLGDAGSLPQSDTLSVLAYMLQQNGRPATGRALTADHAALAAMAFASSQTAMPAPLPSPGADFTAGARGLAPRARFPSQADLLDAAQGRDWLMSNKDFAGDRTSPLRAIDTTNVAHVRKLCSIALKPSARAQTSPVVHDGVIYVTSGFSTAAVDAVSCKLRWQHDWPSAMPGAESAANRGVAIKDGRVIRGTADGHLLALDAADGALLWARRVSNPGAGELITMQPLIYDDLIFIGPAVSEFGIHGWIGAYRLSDGAPVWRFNIVPRPGEPGAETWAQHPTVPLGGGSVWNALAIDAAHEILFVPTANPAPDFAASLRGGANLYTNSVVALHLRTGALAWYRQIRPHDDHDWDVTQVSPLYHATIDGKPHDLLAQTGKDGQLRVFDRDSHAQMFATPLTTIRNAEAPVTEQGVDVCPGVLGGVQWNGAAYLPSQNLLVAPAVDWCSRYTLDHDVTFIPFQTYLGGQSTMIPPASGWLTALDASTGQVKWRYHASRPMIAAVTTTAGGLVLTGELTGNVLALDAADGRVLARLPVGGQLGAGIVTYQVNGRQYIAAASGTPSAYWANPPGGGPGLTVFGLP